MTSRSLGESYLRKARARLATLPILRDQAAYSDVVRESQEVVELALKGMLRLLGIEPPKWHDVGGFLLEYSDRFPAELRAGLPALAGDSAWLRKEREFSFCGEIDLIPSEQYGLGEAQRAEQAASRAVAAVERLAATLR